MPWHESDLLQGVLMILGGFGMVWCVKSDQPISRYILAVFAFLWITGNLWQGMQVAGLRREYLGSVAALRGDLHSATTSIAGSSQRLSDVEVKVQQILDTVRRK